jgi:hypothetical protein
VTEIYEKKVEKEYNRENIIQQSQIASNTPRTFRNERINTSKRQTSSLHTRILNGITI